MELAKPLVPRHRNPGIRLPDQPDAPVRETRGDSEGPVRRPVIDDHQRPVAMRLRQHRRHRVADPAGRVERGNDDTDMHRGETARPLTRKP